MNYPVTLSLIATAVLAIGVSGMTGNPAARHTAMGAKGVQSPSKPQKSDGAWQGQTQVTMADGAVFKKMKVAEALTTASWEEGATYKPAESYRAWPDGVIVAWRPSRQALYFSHRDGETYAWTTECKMKRNETVWFITPPPAAPLAEPKKE
jgi:hypothetical protein